MAEIGRFSEQTSGPEGSNPSRSAKQSAIFAFSAGTSKIAHMFAHFLLSKGTGETQIRLSAVLYASILSVENRDGAPSHHDLPKNAFARTSPFSEGIPNLRHTSVWR